MRFSRILFDKIKPSTKLAVAQQSGPLKQITANIFGALFGKYLLTTNIVSSGILMSIGDLMSQEIEFRKGLIDRRYDWNRNAKMFVVGAIQGPIHHYFYGWLDRVYVGASIKTTTIKILYDQLVMSPVCIVAFFYSAGWLDRQSTAECTKELKSKMIKVYITDWMVWPGTQFINFYYLHPKYRVIYVNFITMLYNVFLSYVKHDQHVIEANSSEKLN